MDRTGAADQQFSDVRLRVADARVASLLLGDARNRAVARVFGVSSDRALLLSVVALGTAAVALNAKVQKALRGPGGPTAADAALGIISLKEVVYRIAGTDSRETPLLGTLILIAVIEAAFGPARRGSVRAIRTSSHALRTAFDNRLGILFPARDRRP